MSAEARAARGAALLDWEKPGWEDRVYLHRLNMRLCNSCVLGQLYGDFRDTPWGKGFRNPRNGFVFGLFRPGYRRLTVAWTREIQRRRVASLEKRASETVSDTHRV